MQQARQQATQAGPIEIDPATGLARALRQALKDITGQEFKDPREFREYLKRPEVKRKVRGN